MKTFKVYLAGPIAGKTYDQAEDWRKFVAESLPREIVAYSPMRGKEYLREAGVLGKGSYDQHQLSTAPGVMNRDRNDVKTSDAVLMNLLDAKKVSIGSVMEGTWCDAYRVPLVLVMEKGNIHEHLMFSQCATYITDSLQDALALVTYLLLPGRTPASADAEATRKQQIAQAKQQLLQASRLLKEIGA